MVNRTATSERPRPPWPATGPPGPDDVVGADLLVQATPLGMGEDGTLPVDLRRLLAGQAVADPCTTRCARRCSRGGAGCRTVDGPGMPVHQGARQPVLDGAAGAGGRGDAVEAALPVRRRTRCGVGGVIEPRAGAGVVVWRAAELQRRGRRHRQAARPSDGRPPPRSSPTLLPRSAYHRLERATSCSQGRRRRVGWPTPPGPRTAGRRHGRHRLPRAAVLVDLRERRLPDPRLWAVRPPFALLAARS